MLRTSAVCNVRVTVVTTGQNKIKKHFEARRCGNHVILGQYPDIVIAFALFLSGKVSYHCSIRNVMSVHLMHRLGAILCKDQTC